MPIRYISRGTGITKRRVLALGRTSSDICDTLRRAAATRSFEGISHDIEISARAILQAAGIDPQDRRCERVADDSPEDFCDRILSWLDIARGARSNNDFDGYGRAITQVIRLATELDFKLEWEKPALAGSKSLEGAKAGGKNRSDSLRERNLEMAREFQRRRPTSRLKDSALKAAIGTTYDCKRTAAIEAIDKGLKLLSG